MLIALQLGLLLLALLIPQQVYAPPVDTPAPMAQQAATTTKATTKATTSGSSSTRQSTVSVLVVSLSSLLLRLHF